MEDVIEKLVKFNSQTAGRDRFFRLLQYSSKLAGWALDNWQNKDLVAKLKNLEYTFAAFRKLLRLGRTVDAFYSTLGTFGIQDTFLRATISMSRLNFALYLLADHVTWLKSMGLVNANQSRWSSWSNRFWLYNIVMNLLRDFYEIVQILSATSTTLSCFEVPAGAGPADLLSAGIRGSLLWMQRNKEVSLDTIKNGLDFWLPYNALGHSDLSAGMIGFFGVLSSLAAILPLVDASYKLVPS